MRCLFFRFVHGKWNLSKQDNDRLNCYSQYSFIIGRSMQKSFELINLYKNVQKFNSNAHTIYIFPIDDRLIFRFYLKYKNLNKLVIPTNSFLMSISTWLIVVLYSFCCWFIYKFWKVVYSCGLKRYAKSL